jgi:predicted RNA binding protein YcfA (HicA-like mRNA interferase family)
MGKKRYPPLTPKQVVSILEELSFSFKRQDGSHAQYEKLAADGKTRTVVTVDMAVDEFWVDLIKNMIQQSGYTREEFYRATKSTGKKI